MYSWDWYSAEFNLLGKIHGSIQSKCKKKTLKINMPLMFISRLKDNLLFVGLNMIKIKI